MQPIITPTEIPGKNIQKKSKVAKEVGIIEGIDAPITK